MVINSLKVLGLLKAQKGRMFKVTFIKKDGTVRDMVARFGVKHDLKGGTNNITHEMPYVTVWDMQKHAYRNINLSTVLQIKAGGETWSVMH